MILQKRINFIKKISLFLFTFSFLSLILSLLLQNILANYTYAKGINDKKIQLSKFFSDKIICSDNVELCRKNQYFGFLDKAEKLGDCYIYNYDQVFIVDNLEYSLRRYLFINSDLNNNLKPQFKDKEVEIQIRATKIDKNCIKNSKHYYLYKVFPFFYEYLYDLKQNPKTSLGARETINPFLYGETSISNIVKRFPINYVFKSFLFVSVILMYLYWINYNRLFAEIINSKNNKFIYFGIASAVFLFFHVLLLGVELDNKIFKLIRKLIIAFFILSEIIAQFYLSIILYKNKNNLKEFCNTHIINLKLYFVIVIALISFFVISILLIYNLSSKVDYILEWNYFAGLLFYYLLSYLMWKKQIVQTIQPPPSNF